MVRHLAGTPAQQPCSLGPLCEMELLRHHGQDADLTPGADLTRDGAHQGIKVPLVSWRHWGPHPAQGFSGGTTVLGSLQASSS